MPKIRSSQMNKNKREESLADILELLNTLKSKDDAVEFFLGLFTESEILMMARRIQIAKLIIRGESYEKIRKDLGVGFSTITKMDGWLRMSDKKYSDWVEKCRKPRIKKFRRAGSREKYYSELDKYPEYRILKKILQID